MTDFLLEYSQIILQENIPLNNEDIKLIETQQKAFTKAPVILAFCTLFTMGFIALCIKDNFVTFKYYDYILFACAGFSLFGFCYFIICLLKKYDNYNWEKDKKIGKNKLSSLIINRDKTENGEYYLTFGGQHKNDKIRIKVKQTDFYHYRVGTKILVTYLKFSKQALEIIEL